MIALIPVRESGLPPGGDEVGAEAQGRVLVVGHGIATAAAELRTARELRGLEAGAFRPAAWAAALAPILRDEGTILLPATPDGRDLAPGLARNLGRPLLAGALAVSEDAALIPRHGGLALDRLRLTGPVVATLQPGVRGVSAHERSEPPAFKPERLKLADHPDPEPLELLAPDPSTVELSEARRVVAGGQGLGGPDGFADLARLAEALGASLGATRVATDAGWAEQERQIGVTGVEIDPDLYVAIGISGAVQHTAGLGQPGHIIAVNLDPSCPMMEMADLAVVAEGRALIDALIAQLGQDDG
ncbi:MAG TPA: mycofactocin-associated electron transfer flavoprotein alpha subunit [Solirubrobacteraceae bacterium]|nr:mycofactocin-associated electron transfer flavoprotein alpha subunit [Solirubrobacteraceae bacterium]